MSGDGQVADPRILPVRIGRPTMDGREGVGSACPSLWVCGAGDCHGRIHDLYAAVTAFEGALGITFAHVLQVGDLGVWPDPARVDRGTAKHEGAGDFAGLLARGGAVPRPTTFVKGNHEDFAWLDARGGGEILPGLRYLPNGEVVGLPASPTALRIGGLGGGFAPSGYDTPSVRRGSQGCPHYTRKEVERLSRAGRLDVLLLHEAPDGVAIPRFLPGGRRADYQSQAQGLRALLRATRPRVCLFGHHHVRLDVEVEGVPCIGLGLTGRPGHLVALGFGVSGLVVGGDWPPGGQAGWGGVRGPLNAVGGSRPERHGRASAACPGEVRARLNPVAGHR